MATNGSLLGSVIVMIAVTAALVYDLLRQRRARMPHRPSRPLMPRATVHTAPATSPAHLDAAPAAAVPAPVVKTRIMPYPAPAAGPDPVRELAERLAALRLLGLDHVRSAHPLFRGRADDFAGMVAAPTASAHALVLDVAPPVTPPKRRPRRPALAPRSTAALRLVVDRGRALDA